jgi:hypothetical protein
MQSALGALAFAAIALGHLLAIVFVRPVYAGADLGRKRRSADTHDEPDLTISKLPTRFMHDCLWQKLAEGCVARDSFDQAPSNDSSQERKMAAPSNRYCSIRTAVLFRMARMSRSGMRHALSRE